MAWAFLLVAWLGAWAGAGEAALPPLPAVKIDSPYPAIRSQLSAALAEARAHPRDAAANGRLAMTLDAYQQYAAASVCYRRAHRLDPSSLAWLYDLAFVEKQQGLYAAAIRDFRAVLRSRPDYPAAQINLAESLRAAGRLAESSAVFDDLIQAQPGNARAFYGRGQIAAARADTAAAVRAFRRACVLFPQYGRAHYALALAYRRLGRSREAAAEMAAFAADQDRAPPATDPLRAAVLALDHTPQSYLERGLVRAQAGDLQGAIAAERQALRIEPRLAQAYVNLIELYARLGQDRLAESAYQSAVRLDPKRADCYYNHGVLLFGEKQYAPAEAAFRQALALDPNYPEAHNNLGYLLARQGDAAAAEQEFEKAIAARPNYRLARFHLGQLLVTRGRFEAAIAQFRGILEPDDASTPSYLYALGATYARAGQTALAIATLRRARDEAARRGQPALAAAVARDLAKLAPR